MINVFAENGYQIAELRKLVDEVKGGKDRPQDTSENRDNDIRQTVTLPWIPVLSPKLKKIYQKAGYKVVFKSGKNIANILTASNKTNLPKNSYPGVYKVPCSCGKTPYRGETKKRICTRAREHQSNIEKQEWDKSGVALHSKNCDGHILFENVETVKVIHNKFERKVRETLEIQKYNCHLKDGGMNPDKGQYVTTKLWFPYLRHLRQLEEAQSSKD